MLRCIPGRNQLPAFPKLAVVAIIVLLAACDNGFPTESAFERAVDLQAVAGPFNALNPNQPNERFIITFSEHVADVPGLAQQLTQSHGGDLLYTYNRVLRGFAAALPAEAVAALQRNPQIASIEPDLMVATTDMQSSPPWGLDRIDQRTLPLSGTYAYASSGSGVTAYIIDTGIRYTHYEFNGRAVFGFDAVGNTSNPGQDCNGHGTHVAGTVGGKTYGVAKAVTLVSVRVLDCNGRGYLSGVIAGMDWVAANRNGPSVANMSLGAGLSLTLNQAVARLSASGVVVVVAAGNSNTDACTASPASAAEAITVGATDNSDTRASFSNYGSCVDLFAPGVSVLSSTIKTDASSGTMSGTSMAAPHAAGVAAVFLGRHPFAPVTEIADSLNAWSTKGVVKSAQSANNHLLYSPGSNSATPPPPPSNQSPSAAFAVSCSGLTCSFTDQSSDPDGSIETRWWSFGDGGASSAQNPQRTYAAAGSYTATLTVTDNAGATASTSKTVTVSAPAASPISLTASSRKVKNARYVDLAWSGASSGNVDLYRNGALVVTVANHGYYTDTPLAKAGGTLTYRVCESGTSVCSADEVVSF